jgi:integrase
MTTQNPRGKKSGPKRTHGTGHVFERNGAVHVKFRPLPGRPPVQRKICRIGELTGTQIERRRATIEAEWKPPADGEMPTVTRMAWRYVARLREEEKAPIYIGSREGAIRTHLQASRLGERAVDSVKPKDIRAAYAELKAKGVRAPTMVSIHWLLSGTFRVAMEDEHRIDNPVAAVATPAYDPEDEVRPLTSEEVNRVLAAVPDDELGRIERAIYRVAQHTGMRRGELIALRVKDCQFALDSFDVCKNFVAGAMKDTKGHEARTVPMTPTAKKALIDLLAGSEFTDPEDLVFTLTGQPLPPEKVSKRFKDALLRAAVGPVEMRYYKTSRGRGKLKPFPLLKLHQLRDTFASHNMANPRIAPIEVQNGLGHKDLSTTSRRYGKYIPQADTAERMEESFADRPPIDPQFDPQKPRQQTEKGAKEGSIHA